MQAKDTERRKLDDRDYSVQCVECGTWFEATRSDASYCSAKCRKRAHFAPIRRQNAMNELDQMIKRLHSIRSEYPRDKEFFERFVSLARVAAYQAASYESMEYNSGHIPAAMKAKAIEESNAVAKKLDKANSTPPKPVNKDKCPHCHKTGKTHYVGDMGMYHCWACDQYFDHYE